MDSLVGRPVQGLDPATLADSGTVTNGQRVMMSTSRLRRQANPTEGEHRPGESTGQRLADRVTSTVGSWPFIVIQSVLLLIWIALNTVAWQRRWDPYPFILLNLVLSFQAAFTAPIILMSQNRQTTMDRFKAEDDYAVDRLAEQAISEVHTRLDQLTGPQWTTLLDIQQQQLELLQRMEALTRELKLAASEPASLRGDTPARQHASSSGPAEHADPADQAALLLP